MIKLRCSVCGERKRVQEMGITNELKLICEDCLNGRLYYE